MAEIGEKDCFWSLFNTVDDVRLDGLRTRQVRTVLRTVDAQSLAEWLVWKEGATDWKRADETILEFAKHELAPKPAPAGSILFHETEQEDPMAGMLDMDAPEKGPERRTTPRYEMSLKVFLNAHGKVHTNETLNVSVGGLKLVHPLPLELEGSYDVTLINGASGELGMRCRILREEGEEDATRLLIEHCNRIDILRTWIASAQK